MGLENNGQKVSIKVETRKSDKGFRWEIISSEQKIIAFGYEPWRIQAFAKASEKVSQLGLEDNEK